MLKGGKPIRLRGEKEMEAIGGEKYIMVKGLILEHCLLNYE